MLRLVLDTNVVLDLFHWANHEVWPLMQALESGRIVCLADTGTLAELSRVLTYPQLKLSPEMQVDRYQRYQRLVTLIPAGEVAPLPRCRDKDDQQFLELASRGKADLLVSRDKMLLTLKGRTKLPFRILLPAAASARVSAEEHMAPGHDQAAPPG